MRSDIKHVVELSAIVYCFRLLPLLGGVNSIPTLCRDISVPANFNNRNCTEFVLHASCGTGFIDFV